jgi:hypothetical protein
MWLGFMTRVEFTALCVVSSPVPLYVCVYECFMQEQSRENVAIVYDSFWKFLTSLPCLCDVASSIEG